MKAEERKQLETNELAQQVSALLAKTKQSPSMLWVFLGLGLALIVVYYFWTGLKSEQAADAWAYYWNNRLLIDDAREKLKGTSVDLVAQLTWADDKYERAFQSLFVNPDTAKLQFKEASDAYAALAKNTSAANDLIFRSFIGAAKCEEAMGDLERAKFFYGQLLDRFKNDREYNRHPWYEAAAKQKKALEEAGSDAMAFYKNWPTRLPKITDVGPGAASPPVP